MCLCLIMQALSLLFSRRRNTTLSFNSAQRVVLLHRLHRSFAHTTATTTCLVSTCPICRNMNRKSTIVWLQAKSPVHNIAIDECSDCEIRHLSFHIHKHSIVRTRDQMVESERENKWRKIVNGTFTHTNQYGSSIVRYGAVHSDNACYSTIQLYGDSKTDFRFQHASFVWRTLLNDFTGEIYPSTIFLSIQHIV